MFCNELKWLGETSGHVDVPICTRNLKALVWQNIPWKSIHGERQFLIRQARNVCHSQIRNAEKASQVQGSVKPMPKFPVPRL